MSFEREAEVLEAEIRKAGHGILEIAAQGFEVFTKIGDDPVTVADLAADASLKKGLLAAFPETGWLSEETVDNPARLQKELVWIVDPIDGTREFAAGIPEYAVSVALVQNGNPVVAAVYNPPKDELYTARAGKGAWLNGVRLSGDRAVSDPPVMLASRSEVKRGEWAQFDDLVQIHICGSIAYKLALIAGGEADGTFSLGPKNEWDIAAGVLLVQETGGVATDKTGKAFRFNSPKTLVNGIVGATSAYASVIWGLLS